MLITAGWVSSNLLELTQGLCPVCTFVRSPILTPKMTVETRLARNFIYAYPVPLSMWLGLLHFSDACFIFAVHPPLFSTSFHDLGSNFHPSTRTKQPYHHTTTLLPSYSPSRCKSLPLLRLSIASHCLQCVSS